MKLDINKADFFIFKVLTFKDTINYNKDTGVIQEPYRENRTDHNHTNI